MVASTFCSHATLMSLELVLRLGVLSTPWKQVTRSELDENLYVGKQPAEIAVRACLSSKHPQALALLLRWGGPIHQRGLETASGISWMHVAQKFARIFYTPYWDHYVVRAMDLVDTNAARPREVLARLFELAPERELAKVAFVDPRRGDQLVRWRRAVEVRRNARLIFQAAAQGRPMELERRLQLGKLADGGKANARGGRQMVALSAARAGGHSECVSLLEDNVTGLSGTVSGAKPGV